MLIHQGRADLLLPGLLEVIVRETGNLSLRKEKRSWLEGVVILVSLIMSIMIVRTVMEYSVSP